MMIYNAKGTEKSADCMLVWYKRIAVEALALRAGIVIEYVRNLARFEHTESSQLLHETNTKKSEDADGGGTNGVPLRVLRVVGVG